MAFSERYLKKPQNSLCAGCLRGGWHRTRNCADVKSSKRTPSLYEAATQVDHIFPIRQFPEYKWEESLMQPLCHSCHRAVSWMEAEGLAPDFRRNVVHDFNHILKERAS